LGRYSSIHHLDNFLQIGGVRLTEQKSKTSEAQKEANRRYRQKNKEKLKIGSYARTAKMFIREHATATDIVELRKLLDEREEQIKNSALPE